MSAPTDERTNEKEKTTLHRLKYEQNYCQLKPDCQKINFELKHGTN